MENSYSLSEQPIPCFVHSTFKHFIKQSNKQETKQWIYTEILVFVQTARGLQFIFYSLSCWWIWYHSLRFPEAERDNKLIGSHDVNCAVGASYCCWVMDSGVLSVFRPHGD